MIIYKLVRSSCYVRGNKSVLKNCCLLTFKRVLKSSNNLSLSLIYFFPAVSCQDIEDLMVYFPDIYP